MLARLACVLLGVSLCAGPVQTGTSAPDWPAYLGQQPPGEAPRVFAPGIISRGNIHGRLAISPDGHEIIVGNMGDDSVTVIDAVTHAVTATVKLPERSAPNHLRYSPDGKTVFISSVRPGAGVLRMNSATRKITGHLPMDRFCGGMNFSPDQRVLYITDFPGGTISQVDPETMKVTKTLHTGAGAASPQVVQ